MGFQIRSQVCSAKFLSFTCQVNKISTKQPSSFLLPLSAGGTHCSLKGRIDRHMIYVCGRKPVRSPTARLQFHRNTSKSQLSNVLKTIHPSPNITRIERIDEKQYEFFSLLFLLFNRILESQDTGRRLRVSGDKQILSLPCDCVRSFLYKICLFGHKKRSIISLLFPRVTFFLPPQTSLARSPDKC